MKKMYVINWETLAIYYADVVEVTPDTFRFPDDSFAIFTIGETAFDNKEECLKKWQELKKKEVINIKAEIVRLEQLQPKIDEI